MKKTLKRIGALALALCLVLALSATAFAAADMEGEAGVIGEFPTTSPDTPTTQDTSVVIYKEITALNPEDSTVNAPTITYNYTIGAATVADGTTVTDNASHHNQLNGADVNATVAVKAGVGTPTITGTAAGVLALTTADQLSASEYGTANRFDLTVSFDGIFKTGTTANYSAGVYRYVINETTTAANKNAAGIAEGSGANTLYMDVYVDGSGNIYGYSLFTTNASIDASTSDDAAAAAVGKTEGFVGSEDDGDEYASDTSTADKYYTFNLAITKDVVNDAFIETTKHQFPFTVTLDNPSVTAAVLPIMTVGTNATQSALTAGAIGTGTEATVWTPTIADGATVTYVGIPCGTTVTIKETNDVSGVSYNSVSTNADTNAAAKTIDTGVDSNNAIVNCGATALAVATDNHTATDAGVVTFTNTLLQISPTGVVIRVAPFMMILAAGIVLLVLSIRRRRLADDEA